MSIVVEAGKIDVRIRLVRLLGGDSKRVGEELLKLHTELFRLWHRVRDAPSSPPNNAA